MLWSPSTAKGYRDIWEDHLKPLSEQVWLKRLVLDAYQTPMIAELAPMIDGKPDFTKLKEIHLEELARRFRMQRIVFETASEVYEQMAPTWKGSREYLLAQLVRLVERYIESGRVVVDPPLFN